MGPISIRGDFKDLKQAATARVDKVVDGQTVLMTDGKIVRLLGIDYPMVTGDAEGGPAILGKMTIEQLLPKNKEVMLYQNKNREAGRINRMGHSLAHLVIKDRGEWVNGALVARGVAWTATDATNPAMAAQLYKLEDEARKSGKGLWSKNSPFGLLTPDNASDGNGTFRVVEGTVNRAATSKNNLYLNFGNDWKKDFTVMITPAIRKSLAKHGVDAMSLAGKKVRVRGWLREWNGPFMELETPERLEVLSTAQSPVPSTDPVEKSTLAQPRSTGQTNP